MKTVWKFKLDVTAEQEIAVPKGAKVLDAQEQHGGICLWVLLDDAVATTETVRAYVCGTGHRCDAPSAARYFRTVQMGPYVWHLWLQGGE